MPGNKIKITIVEQKGTCESKHEKRQQFTYDNELPDICPAAWHSIYPYVRTLAFGGNLPWEKTGEAYIACPDPNNPVVFKLERE